jgi:5-methylcytosine-specific restriction protein A
LLKNLTAKRAVLQALAEYDHLGREAFLKKYGFGEATHYYILHDEKYYDSKAVVGVAYGYQFGRPLRSGDFGGGKATVLPTLSRLGFLVLADRIQARTIALPEEAETNNLSEGDRMEITVNRYERSANARTKCIEHHGTSCCVCGFDFAVVYGDAYVGYIHVHHLTPHSSHSKDQGIHKVNPVEDLRPVCPNCHAVIHYGGKTRPIDEVRTLIAKNKPKPTLRPSHELP